MQRVKFTFNKKPRNQLMEDLDLYNSRYVSFQTITSRLIPGWQTCLDSKEGVSSASQRLRTCLKAMPRPQIEGF